MEIKYPKTKKIEKIDNYHGTKISDPYQWLENSSDKNVQDWINKQTKLSKSIINKLSQKPKLEKRFNELSRYDEKTIPWEVLKGKRTFFHERKKSDEKWIYYTQDDKESKKTVLINPNKWPKSESLSFTTPSVDGKYLAFGKDKGGDENTKIYIMEVRTKKILKDSVKGWKQGRVSWLHDNSGFYYSRKPLKGEVPKNEEYYWDEVYFHKLGTKSSEDKRIFFHKTKKEYFHTAFVSEDGKYVIFYRSTFGKNDIYFRRVDSDKLIPIMEGFEADCQIKILNEKIIIKTDLNAQNGRVFSTEINKPERKNWKEIIPESEDKLYGVKAISGNLYLEYLHKAHSKIKIFTLDGKHIKNLNLPVLGSATIYGSFSKSQIAITFSSFFFPPSTYEYDFNKNKLDLFFKPDLNIQTSKFIIEQVQYKSKDGTKITMFVLRNKNMKKNKNNPILLTGYGGFDISMTPSFSISYVTWLEAGGAVGIPNLRGGGEYGKKWHESGKLNRKQNVFDDFISAAEWLISHKYTNPKKLAIFGGSNGGLLVGAVSMQRPELFKAVGCAVPLLDMLRYHKLGIANTWATEYGSSENKEQFKYIYKYSPYHNIKENTRYPSMLFTTSENDARVDPMHAIKMVAKLQEFNLGNEPILILVRKGSGHCGGTTISKRVEHTSEWVAFLMDRVGMKL